MLDDLAAAAQAYADAQTAVAEAQRQVAERRAEIPAARDRLAAAIVAATRAGHRQVEIMAASGYSRESVRRIQRAAGIEPADD